MLMIHIYKLTSNAVPDLRKITMFMSFDVQSACAKASHSNNDRKLTCLNFRSYHIDQHNASFYNHRSFLHLLI